jgi:hypothetical protein
MSARDLGALRFDRATLVETIALREILSVPRSRPRRSR